MNKVSHNNVVIQGTLLSTTFADGKTRDGKPYLRGNMLVRVVQTYGGKEEVSEVPVSYFATQYKKDGSPNPAYENILELKGYKTAVQNGNENADYIRINMGSLQENSYVNKAGVLYDGWQIRSSFFSKGGKVAPVASFTTDIFVMNIKEEFDREENPTGRLIVQGGIVQYGDTLDVIDFYVEDPEAVDFIQRNWETNKTYRIWGRIRSTSKEVQSSQMSGSSWGEDIPEMTTVRVREIILTKGTDEPLEEGFDDVEIRKMFNARKARREQMQQDAREKKSSSAATSAEKKSAYDWQ